MKDKTNFNVNDTIFHDIAAWMQLDPALADVLYASPFVVQAVFRSLPPLARLYIPRLLHLPSGTPIPLEEFRRTLRRRQRAKDRHDTSIRTLRALHVFMPSGDHFQLHPHFAEHVRRAITYTTPSVFGDSGLVDESHIASERLDNFSADRLENILNYVVESSGQRTPSGNVITSLVYTHILEQNDRAAALCISKAGFHFLLKHSFAQLWILLRSIVLAVFAPRGQQALANAIDFLFTMSFATPGNLYSVHALTDDARDLLSDLDELGIVMMLPGSQSFRPTLVGVRLLNAANRIGLDLTSADVPNVTRTTGEIHIFVETNFRVYAYTSSPFQTNLLGLFTHLRCKLPGLVVGHLTRDNVRNALLNGITAKQIIAYLNAHGHPRMKKGQIPPNVSDEIKLWEAEQERVQMSNCVFMADFQSQASFEQVLSYAGSLGAVLWSNAATSQLAVDTNNYDAVKLFIKREGLH